MAKLLADTSALLALAMRDDRNHEAAVEFVRRNPQARFVVTELIVSEVATRVRARAGAGQAAALARSLLESRRYELVFVDMELLRGAVERLARFSDKRLSLTDCASFELMDRLELTSAFTFDSDFRDCGYTMAP
ncbi:MAG: PIN domain-containing protein [candidate division NC10 bacterium]